MNSLIVSVIIGIVAGIIDILPMIVQKLNKRSILSAFLQYFFISIVIVHIDLPFLSWWLEGGLIALALSVPVIIIVSENDRKAAPVIAAMSIVLGSMIGLAAHYLK